MDYKKKYLKYKEKYLKLKELIGGKDVEPLPFPLYCDGKKVTVVMGRKRPGIDPNTGSERWQVNLLYFNDLQIAYEEIKRHFRNIRPFHIVCEVMSMLYHMGTNDRLTLARDDNMFFQAVYGTFILENLPGGDIYIPRRHV